MASTRSRRGVQMSSPSQSDMEDGGSIVITSPGSSSLTWELMVGVATHSLTPSSYTHLSLAYLTHSISILLIHLWNDGQILSLCCCGIYIPLLDSYTSCLCSLYVCIVVWQARNCY